jgi:spermidine/putrescine transport system substrate-binding protein
MVTDFKNGNVWIAYAWGNAFSQLKNAEIPVVYPFPKEGRLSWNCGLVLAGETENYYHAHAYADAWLSKQSAEWIIPNYAYGHVNTTVDTSTIDPALVEAFALDDPGALQEPRAHLEQYVPDRRRFARAWDEVKAA